jgi:hypothetical protein
LWGIALFSHHSKSLTGEVEFAERSVKPPRQVCASTRVVGTKSSAGATFPGDLDLAGAFGNVLDATATGSNGFVDILPSL